MSTAERFEPPDAQRGSLAVRVLFQQPVCPAYRRDFFEQLSGLTDLTVLAGYQSNEDRPLRSIAAGPEWLALRHNAVGPAGVHHLRLHDGDLDLSRYDVVVVNFNPRHTASLRVFHAAGRQSVPRVWWGQIWSWSSSKRNLALRRRLMNRCDGVIVYTPRERRMAAAIGVTSPVVSMNNSCLDAATLSTRYEALPAAAPRGARFLFLGRLTDKSRYRWILRLARRLGERAHFTLVGASADQRRELDRHAGANLRIVEATGNEQDKRGLLLEADYFLYPGGIGLSVLEALSTGLPVLTHGDRRRHSPEHAYLRNGFNAAFYDGSFDDLERLVATVLDGRLVFPPRHRIAAAVADLSTEAMAGRVAQFLQQRCGGD